MSDANTLIADRLAISDVIIRYATALDTRDWRLLRSILTDRVAIDYTSFDPDLDLEMDAAEWVHRVRGLAGFDATQHLSTNHRHHIDGDTATCRELENAELACRRALLKYSPIFRRFPCLSANS